MPRLLAAFRRPAPRPDWVAEMYGRWAGRDRNRSGAECLRGLY